MELARRYSNHADLHERLVAASQRATVGVEPQVEPDDGSVSGRTGGTWRVQDRLSDEDVKEIIKRFRAGTTREQLMVQFGVSLSSIKRVLRCHGVRR